MMPMRAINVWGALSVALVLSGWQIALALRHGPVSWPLGDRSCGRDQFPHDRARARQHAAPRLHRVRPLGLVMVPFGIACGRLRALGLVVDPILEFLVTIPPPAVIPIVMLLAGVGDVAKIAVISYAMVPNILINTIETVRQAPPMLERVGRSLRFSRGVDGADRLAGSHARHRHRA